MRYLNLLEAQLVAASRELSGAPAASTARARTRLRALVRRHTYISAVLALVTVASASGAIADASGLLGGPDLTAPSPLGMASSVPSGLAASFAVLRRPRDPAVDAVPTAGTAGAISVVGGIGQHYGVNLDLSRFVGTVDGSSVWLIPGSTGSCIYISGDGGGVCGPNDLASSMQGLVQHLVPVAGGATTFIGALPDGASVTATNTDGTRAPVSVSGAAFNVSGDTSLRSVTIHEADGQTLTLDGRSSAPSPTPPAGGGMPSP
jgi:hypothetical protein